VAIYGPDAIRNSGELQERKLVELLGAHVGEPLDARRLLDGALAQANKTNRRVLLLETKSDGRDCHRMVRYLDANRALWEKDFILVRVDRRLKNGEDLLDEIQRRETRLGDPWMAILDAKSNVMITSDFDAPFRGGGYPRDLDQIEHFMKMLKQTAQRLNGEDLWKLRVGLDALPSD
jgi:hypothetical protein